MAYNYHSAIPRLIIDLLTSNLTDRQTFNLDIILPIATSIADKRGLFSHHLHRAALVTYEQLLTHLSPVMRANQIPSFLEEQRTQATEEFQTTFLEFEDFWERKLWHPLTEALIAYFNLPASAAQRLPMFREFVLSFADKINQLKLVELGLMASKGCAGMCWR